MRSNSLEILGVKVDALEMKELNEFIFNSIESKDKCLISNHNFHSVYLFHNDSDFKKTYEIARYVHIDGMPLVLWGKLLGLRIEKKHRITYLDWIHPLLKLLNNQKCKVFYLGSKEGVAQKAANYLHQLYPNITFHVHHGFFDVNGTENEKIINDIRNLDPHLLMVGMGMPRQEKWIYNNFDQLPNTIILPCGACFDYIAGEVKTPPRWLGRFYLEWLYRFIYEPKRLFRRYFIEPIFLIPYFTKDLFKR